MAMALDQAAENSSSRSLPILISLMSRRSATLPARCWRMDVVQMPRVLIEHEFWLDAAVRNRNDSDTEVVAPSAIRRRSRVEENRLTLALDQRDVTVTIDDAIDRFR